MNCSFKNLNYSASSVEHVPAIPLVFYAKSVILPFATQIWWKNVMEMVLAFLLARIIYYENQKMINRNRFNQSQWDEKPMLFPILDHRFQMCTFFLFFFALAMADSFHTFVNIKHDHEFEITLSFASNKFCSQLCYFQCNCISYGLQLKRFHLYSVWFFSSEANVLLMFVYHAKRLFNMHIIIALWPRYDNELGNFLITIFCVSFKWSDTPRIWM